MRGSILTAGVGLAAALGCGGLVEIPGQPEQVEIVPATPAPEPEPALAAPSTDAFEGFDGWVGQAVELEPGDRWWVPRSGGAVVVWRAEGWDAVRSGASFVGLTGSGPVDLVFTGVADVGWCDGARPAATFASQSDVAPGAVWIVEEAGAGSASAPREKRRASASRRLFGIPGGVEVDLQRGRTVVERGGGRPWVHTYSGPSSLLALDAVGPMWPELALTEGDVLSILFRVHAPDRIAWEWVRIDGRQGESIGRVEVDAAGCD